MGSFAGVKFDAQNFQNTVDLAQQKALDEQYRLEILAMKMNNYRTDLANTTFPDGQYYIASDFNSQLISFRGDYYNPKSFTGVMPVLKSFKKGEIVNVITMPTNMSGGVVKAIQTDSGNFYADQNKLSKTKPVEPITTESLNETRRRNEDKTKIMIVGAFILGFLLSKD